MGLHSSAGKALHSSAIAEATGLNLVEAPKNYYFGLLRNCLNCDSTAMVTSSFHLYSHSSHHFILYKWKHKILSQVKTGNHKQKSKHKEKKLLILMSLLMLMPAHLHIDISVVMPMLMFMLMSLVKTGLQVISLFCIVHPYCAYFFASLARAKHIGNMHFEVNIHLFHTVVP